MSDDETDRQTVRYCLSIDNIHTPHHTVPTNTPYG